MALTDRARLRELLERHGFTFSKAMGQNFLVNPSVCPRMAELGGAAPGVGVLEIGPGDVYKRQAPPSGVSKRRGWFPARSAVLLRWQTAALEKAPPPTSTAALRRSLSAAASWESKSPDRRKFRCSATLTPM